jgi:ABC-type dipeptide/oligopeptide/nickel transport system permease component
MVIAGGAAMIHRRRRWLALFAAYTVAALSVPFFLLGIWAILLLSRPDIRQEFARLPVKSHDDH